jgi:hypothetical protein
MGREVVWISVSLVLLQLEMKKGNRVTVSKNAWNLAKNYSHTVVPNHAAVEEFGDVLTLARQTSIEDTAIQKLEDEVMGEITKVNNNKSDVMERNLNQMIDVLHLRLKALETAAKLRMEYCVEDRNPNSTKESKMAPKIMEEFEDQRVTSRVLLKDMKTSTTSQVKDINLVSMEGVSIDPYKLVIKTKPSTDAAKKLETKLEEKYSSSRLEMKGKKNKTARQVARSKESQNKRYESKKTQRQKLEKELTANMESYVTRSVNDSDLDFIVPPSFGGTSHGRGGQWNDEEIVWPISIKWILREQKGGQQSQSMTTSVSLNPTQQQSQSQQQHGGGATPNSHHTATPSSHTHGHHGIPTSTSANQSITGQMTMNSSNAENLEGEMCPELLLLYSLERINLPSGERIFKKLFRNIIFQKYFVYMFWFIKVLFFQSNGSTQPTQRQQPTQATQQQQQASPSQQQQQQQQSQQPSTLPTQASSSALLSATAAAGGAAVTTTSAPLGSLATSPAALTSTLATVPVPAPSISSSSSYPSDSSFFHQTSQTNTAEKYLLSKLGSEYVKIVELLSRYTHGENNKDFIFKYLPYLFTNAIYYSFYFLCPGSRHLYSKGLRKTILLQIVQVMHGVQLCPISVKVTWNKLFPEDIQDETAEDGEENEMIPLTVPVHGKKINTNNANTEQNPNSSRGGGGGGGGAGGNGQTTELPKDRKLKHSASFGPGGGGAGAGVGAKPQQFARGDEDGIGIHGSGDHSHRPLSGSSSTSSINYHSVRLQDDLSRHDGHSPRHAHTHATATATATSAAAAATARGETFHILIDPIDRVTLKPPMPKSRYIVPRQKREKCDINDISPLMQQYLDHPTASGGKPSQNLLRTIPINWCVAGGSDTHRKRHIPKELHDELSNRVKSVTKMSKKTDTIEHQKKIKDTKLIDKNYQKILKGGPGIVARYSQDLVRKLKSVRGLSELENNEEKTLPTLHNGNSDEEEYSSELINSMLGMAI